MSSWGRTRGAEGAQDLNVDSRLTYGGFQPRLPVKGKSFRILHHCKGTGTLGVGG